MTKTSLLDLVSLRLLWLDEWEYAETYIKKYQKKFKYYLKFYLLHNAQIVPTKQIQLHTA